MGLAILSVRELNRDDVELVADYWAESSADHLQHMGVDLDKLPARADFVAMLCAQLDRPLEERQSYCTIWEADGKSIGHCNVNKIVFGSEAYMHLHIWEPKGRRKGSGAELVRKSLALFFDNLKLDNLYCEPNADNLAPNAVLNRVGFEFIKRYKTVPSDINFEQEVSRWHMTKAKHASLARHGHSSS